jgi:hypothetical protein
MIPGPGWARLAGGALLSGMLLAASAHLAAPPVAEAVPPAPGRHLVGLNLQKPADWTSSAHYADVMKVNRGFGDAPVDSLGWPTADFTVQVFAGASRVHGTYALHFRGQAAKVSMASGDGSVSRIAYDERTNTSKGTVTLNDPRTDLALRFTGTRRTPASPVGSGVTEVKVMRPLSPGATQSYAASELFHAPLKSLLSRVQIVRYMDFMGTNWSRTSVWGGYPWQPSTAYAVGQRVSVHPAWVYEATVAGTSAPSPSAAPTGKGTDLVDGTVHWKFVGYGRMTPSQAGYNRWCDTFGFGWQGIGDPYEHVIRFANETGTDVWINIPLFADDDFIRKLAQLFRHGSDGVMPYTSPQANPVFPPLDPSLKIYLEYSNELWNGAFPQNDLNRDLALAEVAAYPGGRGPLNFDGEKNPYGLAYRRVAKRALEASLIFREVFGDDQMMTRVRPALMTQQGGGDPIDQPMRLLLGYYDNLEGDFVPQPRPPSYYFYGAGGTGYWWVPQDIPDPTLDDMWSLGNYDPTRYRDVSLRGNFARVITMGLRAITYEGGPELTHPAFEADKGRLGKKAWSDPRMATSILEHWKVWRQLGGEEFVFYQAVGDYRWGFTETPYEPATVKMGALESIMNAPLAPVTNGTPIPGAVDGNAWLLDRAWRSRARGAGDSTGPDSSGPPTRSGHGTPPRAP